MSSQFYNLNANSTNQLVTDNLEEKYAQQYGETRKLYYPVRLNEIQAKQREDAMK